MYPKLQDSTATLAQYIAVGVGRIILIWILLK